MTKIADTESGLTVERLRAVLHYDHATGLFTRTLPRNGTRIGDIAGSPERKGYLRISIDGRRYKAHRLAWLYVHGQWPADQLDHRNGIRSDNRIDNLREADNVLNSANAAPSRNNTTGLKGVSRLGKRFVAGIKDNYQRIHLGCYATAEEAAAAYDKAAVDLWGDFARTNERTTA